MDFTRQPIIETVISPREGYKLLIRNSKEANQEEFLVNAVEIISFGSALFFRCQEKRPKAFLLPIADYDVVEVKEARMVLKNISTDKPIKIGEVKTVAKETPEKNDKKEASEGESKKTAKKRHSRKRRSAKAAAEKEGTEEVPSDHASKEVSSEATQEIPEESKSEKTSHKPARHANRFEESKTHLENGEAAMPVVSVIFPPPPKIIGRMNPVPPKAEVFPSAVEEKANDQPKENHQESSSQELPPLNEVKEVEPSKAKESVKKET